MVSAVLQDVDRVTLTSACLVCQGIVKMEILAHRATLHVNDVIMAGVNVTQENTSQMDNVMLAIVAAHHVIVIARAQAAYRLLS
jgi:D-alanyl-lipoteichoic acid acyltransferase DltB (MBOAT superfamily)